MIGSVSLSKLKVSNLATNSPSLNSTDNDNLKWSALSIEKSVDAFDSADLHFI